VEGPNLKFVNETTQTLIEVKPDKVILETKATITHNGETKIVPPMPEEIPAKAPDLPESKDGGEAELEVGGKKVKCRIKFLSRTGGPANARVEVVDKAYISDDVPGGLVKSERKSPNHTSTFMLKSFDIK
jgi:hypothetical protein